MISDPLIDVEAAYASRDRVAFLDARAGPAREDEPARGHLPGARPVDLERDLSAPDDPAKGGRHPLPSFETWLRRMGLWGIDRDTDVIVYDAAFGAMAAARAWWMIRAVGHSRVAVLEGGLRAWIQAGFALEATWSESRPLPPYPAETTAWPIVDASAVAEAASRDDWRVIDARAPERFAGEIEPIDPIAGHIPGAHNLYWRTQVDDDGRFDDVGPRRQAYADVLADVRPDHVVCYCGSGVTACHLILGMEAAGLHGARLYVGSWSEWCRNHPT